MENTYKIFIDVEDFTDYDLLTKTCESTDMTVDPYIYVELFLEGLIEN